MWLRHRHGGRPTQAANRDRPFHYDCGDFADRFEVPAVLTVTALTNGEYLLSSVALGIDEYYAGVGEAPGVWLGGWSFELGVEGMVEADALRAVIDGNHPLTGQVSTMVIAIPSVSLSSRGGTHVPGRRPWTIGLGQQADRSPSGTGRAALAAGSTRTHRLVHTKSDPTVGR